MLNKKKAKTIKDLYPKTRGSGGVSPMISMKPKKNIKNTKKN